jgi:hypothetical protein
MTIFTEEYLDAIDIILTRQKICDFNNLDFFSTSPYLIQEKLIDIFCVSTVDGRKGINYPYIETTIPKGERFYRVWSGYDFYKALVKKEFKDSDMWNNPDAPMNRFNKDGEQVLYLCLGSPETALYETNVKEGDVFTLFIYSAKEDIKLAETYISNRWSVGVLNIKRQEKADLLNGFLLNELCRRIDSSNNYFYKLTNSVKHIFANWELFGCDGVRYMGLR